MKAALVQITASDDPDANLPGTLTMIRQAAAEGAHLITTPEVTNCVSASRTRQKEVLRPQAHDATLAAIRDLTAKLGVYTLIGSLALKSDDPQGRFVNRCFLIAPNGEIAAWYDKIHMFDVTISDTESYRESAGYRPGETIVAVETPLAMLGLTICYDLRFPLLFHTLGRYGAHIITVPSAFSPVTGAAHWHMLLRARAIETGAFVLAPAQCGTHPATRGKERRTYGHSLAIAPWGEVLADAGDAPGVTCVDLDLSQVDTARQRVPALQHARSFEGP